MTVPAAPRAESEATLTTERLVIETVPVDLDAGQRLRVSRYTDPGTGADVVALTRTFTDDLVGVPVGDRDALKVPAGCVPDLVAALEELADA